MIADLRIVPATAADAPLLLRLIRDLAEYERLSQDVVATEASLRESLFGAEPGAQAVIAYVGEEPAGVAVWFYNFSTFLGRPGLYLEDLFVRPEWRGRGLGRALLQYLAREAVARRCGRMEWAVLDWNAPAIGFYRSLGAVPMDEWTVYRLTGEALRRLADEERS